MEHSQLNRQAELANKVIVKGIKKRLEGPKKFWVDELPNVLQSYKTNEQTTIMETFSHLTYGHKALIMVKNGEPLVWKKTLKNVKNNLPIRQGLDFLKSCKEMAHI